jgi:hypothetical protein
MKRIVLFIALVATGCAVDPQTARWNQMWADIAFRHQYEQFIPCLPCAGYSKDPPPPKRVVQVKADQKRDPEPKAAGETGTAEAVRDLNTRLGVVEDAVKTNAQTVNANQQMIADQIKALKAKESPPQQ